MLLTALAVAADTWRYRHDFSSGHGLLIDLEGHGRETFDPSLDLSQTVGWFTCLYPVNLDFGEIDGRVALADGPRLGQALKRIKEQLRAIPRRGIGLRSFAAPAP